MKNGLVLLVILLIISGGCDTKSPEKELPQKVPPLARVEKSEPGSTKPQSGPTSSPKKPEAQAPGEKTGPPPYNSIGLPDPFQPARPSMATDALPLEQFETTEYELVGIINGPGIKKALVQDLTGKGFFVQVGTRIGKKNGKVVLIANKEVVIEEPFQDFLGRKNVRKVSLKLP